MTHLTMRVAFWKIKSGPCCRINRYRLNTISRAQSVYRPVIL